MCACCAAGAHKNEVRGYEGVRRDTGGCGATGGSTTAGSSSAGRAKTRGGDTAGARSTAGISTAGVIGVTGGRRGRALAGGCGVRWWAADGEAVSLKRR